ncbi:hypothetical protein RND71_038318 [Anisodus tanguticus]|uniref:Uncharacterized protein n=1 Tax=Anisodus tanguticus TaxID=243964 RepID=A0AAE1UTE1_9SOLA|nr:hypothetical protein RND71_038318 [Anisodus tanguticus]
MSGRTLLLILFFWAVLTIVTPILVRLSASARANGEFFVITHTSDLIKERMKAGKVMGLLARRALVAVPRKKDSTTTLAPEIALSPPSLRKSSSLEIAILN